MKKIAIVLMLLVCLTSVGLANEAYGSVYQFPDNFTELLDRTYQMIHRTVEVDENLIYDVYLFDEYFMTLSAVARGEAVGMSLEGVRDYYNLSLEKYDLDRQFLVLVMMYDPQGRVTAKSAAQQVAVRNSRGQLMSGGIFDDYESVFVFTFPKETLMRHTQGDRTLNLQLGVHDGKLYETSFPLNYKKAVPWKVWELMNTLSSKSIYDLPASDARIDE